MNTIRFDLNNLMSHSIGPGNGVTEAQLGRFMPKYRAAYKHFRQAIACESTRINCSLQWVNLPSQPESEIRKIEKLGREIASAYENVLFLGIGGSYLGLKAAQDALQKPYYNDFGSVRKGRPKIYFEGNNLDPATLAVLLANLNPRKTCVVVISKSGETTETKAAFAVVEKWLADALGPGYAKQVIAITDPASGSLRKRVEREQRCDASRFRSFPLLPGVGGRFSEFNMGLLHLAIIGVRLEEVLAGAAAMKRRCLDGKLEKNPAGMYAALHALLDKDKGKSVAVLMPFSEMLKSTADWYVQLLAESLGKKYRRTIEKKEDGSEVWLQDKRHAVFAGRTPVPSRGTNDLHSIQQNNIEGKHDKVVTFISVRDFAGDIIVPQGNDILSGQAYSRLLSLAREATEWALVREGRPNCTIAMPAVTPYYWAGLLFFFEMATAYEGELLAIDAFNQPGVEGYKNYMYYMLRKPGIPAHVADEIRKHPLVKKKTFVV